MKDPDFSLYLVTHKGPLSHDNFLRIILEACLGGVTIVQLRDKEASSLEMIETGSILQSLLKPLRIPLIINDRIDVALAIQAAGVHLGQSDHSVEEARSKLGKNALIGLSVESIEQATAAQDKDVDYLAASPVFPTETKTDCKKPWGLTGLKKLCAFSRHPVVAIGGINASNTQEVLNCGAAGVAVVSAIFNAPCPRTAAQLFLR